MGPGSTSRFLSLPSLRHQSPAKRKARQEEEESPGKRRPQKNPPLYQSRTDTPFQSSGSASHSVERCPSEQQHDGRGPSTDGTSSQETTLTSAPQLEPPHPRAHLTTQQLTDLYLHKSHSTLHNSPNSTSSLDVTSSHLTPSLLLAHDPSPRHAEPRSPIPAHERNFHCTSRDPVRFSYVLEEASVCEDSCGLELSEGNMRKRWWGDCVRARDEVWLWIGQGEGVVPEGGGRKGDAMRYWVRVREKFSAVRNSWGIKWRGMMEGNALVWG